MAHPDWLLSHSRGPLSSSSPLFVPFAEEVAHLLGAVPAGMCNRSEREYATEHLRLSWKSSSMGAILLVFRRKDGPKQLAHFVFDLESESPAGVTAMIRAYGGGRRSLLSRLLGRS